MGEPLSLSRRAGRTLYGTTLYIAVGVGAARLSGLVLVATVSHSAGPAAVAIYGLATLLGSVAGLGASLGLPTYLTHAYARGEVSLEDVAALHRVRAAGMLILTAIAGAVAHASIESTTAWAFTGFFLATCLDQVNDTAWLTVRGTPRGWVEAPISSGASIVLAIVCLTWLTVGQPTLLQIAGAAGAVSACRALLAYKTVGFPRTLRRVGSFRRRLRHSLPYLGSALLGLAYLRGDVLILTVFVSQASLGYYVSATAMISPVVQLAFMTSLGALADASRASSKQSEASDASSKVADLYLWMATIASGILVVGILIGTPILFSGPIDQIQELGIILTGFLLLRVWNFSLSVRLVDTGAARTRFYTLLTSVALNAALNLLMDPWLGVRGAALATVCTEVFIALTFSWKLAETRSRRRSHVLVCAALIATALGLLVSGKHLFSVGAIYIAALLIGFAGSYLNRRRLVQA